MSALPVSVVIICKNAIATIGQTLEAACRLSTDVVVVDSGSTDGTISLIERLGARLIRQEWLGYGPTKNSGNVAANHDWILSLDADEVMGEDLVTAIRQLDLSDTDNVYKIKRLNYLGDQPIRHGEWNKDWTIRLFNRTKIQWDEAPVHERLILPPGIQINKLNGLLHHFTTPDIHTYREKLEAYADLMAAKYYAQGKKGTGWKPYASSFFSFFKFYLLYAGWLDGKSGWQIALAHARYTFRKYQKLKMLYDKNGKQ